MPASRPAAPRGPLRFGTNGWRGVLAEEVTFERLRAVVAAAGAWAAAERPGAPVLVAHDTRFLGDRLAAAAARALAGAGLRVLRPPGPVPTPVAAHAVRRRRAAGGLVVTASHNPPEYQGVKLLAPGGMAAPVRATREVEAEAARILAEGPPPEAEPRGRPVGVVEPYLRALLGALETGAIGRARPRVLYDALHGAGAGVLDEALRRAGARVELRSGAPDPRFGGAAPDPVPARLAPLRRSVRSARGLRLGLATDGDADRFGVVDADGSVLAETDVLALLVDHLARTGRARRGVVLSPACGARVERVAREHGLAVQHRPIGFKHLAGALAAGEADVAGEVTGGFAWRRLGFDKDGMLAGALLAELVATSGAPLGERLRHLARRFGPSACGRAAVAADARRRRGLAALGRAAPRRVDGARVVACDTRDGVHLALEDGFLLLRASGTEPRLRIYAEAPGPRRLAKRLRAGEALLARAARRRGRS